MKKDKDLQIVEFYWNRLTYRQKKWLRLDAAIQTANENILHWLLILLATLLSTVTRGLPLSNRRLATTVHYIGDRRRQRSGSAVQATFFFIIATITVTAWTIAIQSPAHIAAPIIFANIVFLNVLLVIKSTRHKSYARHK